MKSKWIPVLVLIGIVVGVAGAQVYPVQWEEESEEPQLLLPAVASGVVALGEGAIGLHPDLLTITTIQTGSTAGIKVVDASCSSTNRGEIRLFELSGTGGKIDAFCFCARKQLDGQAEGYSWTCIKIP